jgi:mono/diheme cytochrome c family protein
MPWVMGCEVETSIVSNTRHPAISSEGLKRKTLPLRSFTASQPRANGLHKGLPFLFSPFRSIIFFSEEFMRKKLELWFESFSVYYERLRVVHVLMFALLLILLGCMACSSKATETAASKAAETVAASTPVALPAEVTKDTKNPLTDLAAASAKGKPLYEQNCAFCHGATGASEGAFEPKPPVLNAGHVTQDPDGEIFLTIKNGKGKSMPAQKRLTDEQAWQVTAYVRTLAKK